MSYQPPPKEKAPDRMPEIVIGSGEMVARLYRADPELIAHIIASSEPTRYLLTESLRVLIKQGAAAPLEEQAAQVKAEIWEMAKEWARKVETVPDVPLRVDISKAIVALTIITENLNARGWRRN